MTGEAYELLAMLMRYGFVLIGALILLRAYRWMRKDARNYKREMRRLPDAGLVGEMVDMNTGKSYPLPREGVLGSASSSDIRIRESGVGRRHAVFAFENGRGVKITPQMRKSVMLDGRELQGSGYALHGSQLRVGNTALRVRLFAGLNVPHPVEYRMPEEDDDTDWLPDNGGAAGYPMPGETYAYSAQQQAAAVPEENMGPEGGYMGDYDQAGQMTWDYAYSLDEIDEARRQSGLPEDFAEGAEDGEGDYTYQSPLPRRRRRERH